MLNPEVTNELERIKEQEQKIDRRKIKMIKRI